jgi:hypothetical protein
MKRVAIDERTRELAAASAQQRDALAGAMTPWRERAHGVDGTLAKIRAHSGWIGFLGGFGAGILVAFRPRWLMPSVRMFAAVWPVWRMLPRQRDRRTTQESTQTS